MTLLNNQAERARIAESALIPPRYRGGFDTFFETPENLEVRKRMLEWAENYSQESRGMVLHGATGTGKTHLACATLREVQLYKTQDVQYMNISKLFMCLIDSMKYGPKDPGDECMTEFEIIEKMTGVDLLLLDDLGVEKASDYSAARLYSIINGRYDAMRPTIITTNISLEEIASRLGSLGERIVDRLVETCDFIDLPNRSMRVK